MLAFRVWLVPVLEMIEVRNLSLVADPKDTLHYVGLDPCCSMDHNNREKTQVLKIRNVFN